MARTALTGLSVAYCTGGSGPPLLLLHGFPQTHMMWAQIAPKLAQNFTVICADLRGYGASGKPNGTENYSFRAMGSRSTITDVSAGVYTVSSRRT